MQLPYMSKEIVSKLQSRGKSKNDFKEFIMKTKEERKLDKYFTEKEAKEIEDTIAVLPQMNMKVSCFVKNEEGIYQGDILTIKIEVEIKRGLKVIDPREAPYSVHSNVFPFPKQETLWLTFESKKIKNMMQCIKIHRKFTTCTKEFATLVFEAGKAEFVVHARFDCYKGLDSKEKICIKAKGARPVEAEVEDPDMKEPTMLENIIGQIKKSDDEGSEEEGDKKE